MSAQDVITVATAVTALAQFAKWQGVPDGKGPLVVLVLALFGTGLWAYSRGDFSRSTAFDYFNGWMAVALVAAGVFGFTRAASSAITATKEPPSGAGSSPTAPR